MAERTHGLHAILSWPWMYELFQAVLGVSKFRRRLADEIGTTRGDRTLRVLDLGCGTGKFLQYLPSVEYVGVDPSPRYIAAAQQRFGDRGRFLIGTFDDFPASELGRFDVVTAAGLLHHLNDHQAGDFFARARGLLAPGGRVITIDPTIVPEQHPFARWLVRHDRGLNVRPPQELQRLATPYAARVSVSVHHDRLWFPYSHVLVVAEG